MNLIQIKDDISNGKNLIFYNKDVYNCYKQLKNDYLCIYFNEPLPVKVRLIESINIISGNRKPSLNRLTIAELRDLLVNRLKYKTLIILFNHFERLTKRSVQAYQYLNSLENIRFICSFNKNFKPEVYSFFRTFDLINEDEYKLKHGRKEINITYTVYAILSVYCFFIYMKAASSLVMATILIGGAWFALIIFRTLMYAGGRS
jgi:hypothetical protein